jgi:hypothetical protein
VLGMTEVLDGESTRLEGGGEGVMIQGDTLLLMPAHRDRRRGRRTAEAELLLSCRYLS